MFKYYLSCFTDERRMPLGSGVVLQEFINLRHDPGVKESETDLFRASLGHRVFV
jgi:hypothetical protein